MLITLCPMRRDDSLTVQRDGDSLVLNGTRVDLAAYGAGAAPCDWIIGQPVQEAGVWQVTLILPHGETAPHETRFPAPLSLTGDGPVVLPPHGETSGP